MKGSIELYQKELKNVNNYLHWAGESPPYRFLILNSIRNIYF